MHLQLEVKHLTDKTVRRWHPQMKCMKFLINFGEVVTTENIVIFKPTHHSTDLWHCPCDLVADWLGKTIQAGLWKPRSIVISLGDVIVSYNVPIFQACNNDTNGNSSSSPEEAYFFELLVARFNISMNVSVKKNYCITVSFQQKLQLLMLQLLMPINFNVENAA